MAVSAVTAPKLSHRNYPVREVCVDCGKDLVRCACAFWQLVRAIAKEVSRG